MMRALTATTALAFLLAGCTATDDGEPYTPPADPNLHAYVSNQSFDQPTADLHVTLDGQTLFDGKAPVEDQHNWILREAKLAPGTHTIHATERVTDTEATETFTLPAGAHRWAVIDYWNPDNAGKPSITIRVHDQPVAFD